MKIRSVLVLSLSAILVVAFTGCGGGGGGGSSAGPTAISGVASKGPVAGGAVNVYQLNANGTRGTQISGPFTTDAAGNWKGTIPSNTAVPYMVTVSGGSYVDEATRATLPGGLLSTIVNSATQTSIPITPITDAFAKAVVAEITGNPNQTAAEAVQATESGYAALYRFNPMTVIPADPLNPSATASADSKAYASLLGGFSTLMQHPALAGFNAILPAGDLVSAVTSDLADSQLDGIAFSSPVVADSMTGATLPAVSATGTLDTLATATTTFAAANPALGTPILPAYPAAPTTGGTVILGASPTSFAGGKIRCQQLSTFWGFIKYAQPYEIGGTIYKCWSGVTSDILSVAFAATNASVGATTPTSNFVPLAEGGNLPNTLIRAVGIGSAADSAGIIYNWEAKLVLSPPLVPSTTTYIINSGQYGFKTVPGLIAPNVDYVGYFSQHGNPLSSSDASAILASAGNGTNTGTGTVTGTWTGSTTNYNGFPTGACVFNDIASGTQYCMLSTMQDACVLLTNDPATPTTYNSSNQCSGTFTHVYDVFNGCMAGTCPNTGTFTGPATPPSTVTGTWTGAVPAIPPTWTVGACLVTTTFQNGVASTDCILGYMDTACAGYGTANYIPGATMTSTFSTTNQCSGTFGQVLDFGQTGSICVAGGCVGLGM